ncbi:hypothetical protein GA0074695_4135 [Micromonospora viridifaciens]|uniref:Uncharacterized protein n=1 Tax=Micromonospora viridifaciens TaxID=1881 RepID=A0A1C4YDA9_MICVI|nr:hypothetical protein GA0074695_4135 [Micromonospora viridifaciens]
MPDLVPQDGMLANKVVLRVAAGESLVVVGLGVQPLTMAAQAMLFGQDTGGAELPPRLPTP